MLNDVLNSGRSKCIFSRPPASFSAITPLPAIQHLKWFCGVICPPFLSIRLVRDSLIVTFVRGREEYFSGAWTIQKIGQTPSVPIAVIVAITSVAASKWPIVVVHVNRSIGHNTGQRFTQVSRVSVVFEHDLWHFYPVHHAVTHYQSSGFGCTPNHDCIFYRDCGVGCLFYFLAQFRGRQHGATRCVNGCSGYRTSGKGGNDALNLSLFHKFVQQQHPKPHTERRGCPQPH